MTVEAVTFDATGTLVTCPDLGGEYARVLARHGIGVDAATLGELIPTVWRELACSAHPGRDRFRSHPGGTRGFWRTFVERVTSLAGAPAPSRFAVAELYERFATAAPWRVFDDVRPALAGLATAGLRLAVISNWDERLPRLLRELELAPAFDAIVVSYEVGVEKPHREIFEVAVARLGVAPTETVHVGDSQLEDVEGARAAGLRALRLDRSGGCDLECLDTLPEALARAR
ncbi:MAG: HAD-IA family hydrolase [Holophagales bacterium]|nr:HAD-IA family hydrolase [Holophagales bacterium]